MQKPPPQPTPISPEAAQRTIDSHWPPAPIEHRPLDQCTGRILRQDVYAERDNPPFDRVCMDGIAVSSAVLARGTRQFTIEALQPAGALPLSLKIAENAIEVTTGAMLPGGTDCVIPWEQYDVTGAVVSLKEGVQSRPFRNVH